jgi:hypothetical protein
VFVLTPRMAGLSIEDLDVQVESGVTRKQLDARVEPRRRVLEPRIY